jgi:hypothetical protein
VVTALLALPDLGTEFVHRFNRLEIEAAMSLLPDGSPPDASMRATLRGTARHDRPAALARSSA